MLDNMPKILLGRRRFPSFAAGGWGDASTYRFVVGYQFDGVAMTAGKGSKVAAQYMRAMRSAG